MDIKPSPQNVQDAFLNTTRREKDTVTIYLVSGTKLSGRIKSFDKFSVLLESGTHEQLIFKHAISTVQHVRRTSSEIRMANSSGHATHNTGHITNDVSTAENSD